MSSIFDDAWAPLARAAAEAGHRAKDAVSALQDVAQGCIDTAPVHSRRRTTTACLAGPIIPEPFHAPSDYRPSMHEVYWMSSAFQVTQAFQHYKAQPVTFGLVAGLGAMYSRPGGYSLLQVGLNPARVLEQREVYRLATSPVLHANLSHIVANCTSLVVEGLPLERRLGGGKLLGLVVSTGALSQALYLAATWAAMELLPGSQLARDYQSAYVVGFSSIALALKVVAGYMRDADVAAADARGTEDIAAGGLSVWPALLINQWLVPKADLASHVCGIAAGMLHVYGARWLGRLWWRLQPGTLKQQLRGLASCADLGSSKHPGLGWMDLGAHVLLGLGTCLLVVARTSARSRG